jgi:hypothetical protein
VISSQAKDSIERIFYKAAQARLPMTPGDVCDIVAIKPSSAGRKDRPEDQPEGLTEGRAGEGGASRARRPQAQAGQVVVLTISGILFRLMLLLHFNEDDSTRDYLVKDDAQSTFEEIIAEISNLCCGVMNQELLRYFPDLGMSTPYMLSAQCVPHLEDLKPSYLSSYAIQLGDSVHVVATLCVCADGPIDFVADVNAVEESSGELELF